MSGLEVMRVGWSGFQRESRMREKQMGRIDSKKASLLISLLRTDGSA
jgi:hypothetical protein